MAVHDSGDITEQHLRSLRVYALSPVQIAYDVATTEHSEIAAERQALREFTERISSVVVDTSSTELNIAGRTLRSSSPSLEKIKRAYQETMMTVDHYEDVYDQSLRADFASELGEDLASSVFDGSDTLTEDLKQLIVLTSRQRIKDRDNLLQDLAAEIESLQQLEQKLGRLLRRLDCCRIPNPEDSEVLRNLESLSKERQLVLQTARTHSDRHPICGYLYQHQQWTYPVLTSISRIRSALIID
jgi:DNA repair exonuclease SbcCD ATPase subunit